MREFGIKRENEERRDGGCAVIYDPESKMFAVGKHEDGFLRLFSGGVEKNEDVTVGILREVLEESGLFDFEIVEDVDTAFVRYHNFAKNVNRCGLATCKLLILRSREVKETKLEEHESFKLSWTTLKGLRENWEKFRSQKDIEHWIYFVDLAAEKLKKLGYPV